jgi:hypothetical protein
MDEVDGAVSLHTSLFFNLSSDIRHFVQWGGAGHAQEAVAASAGIWTAGQFLDAAPEAATISYKGFGSESFNYFIDTSPSLGKPNPVLPGNGADIAISLKLKGLEMPGDYIDASAGDLIDIHIHSPENTLTNRSFALALAPVFNNGYLFPTGILGDIQPYSLHLGASPFFVADGLGITGPPGPFFIFAGGFDFFGQIPMNTGGLNLTILFQAVCIDDISPFARPFGGGISDARQVVIQ